MEEIVCLQRLVEEKPGISAPLTGRASPALAAQGLAEVEAESL